jgi:TPR repeat protein
MRILIIIAALGGVARADCASVDDCRKAADAIPEVASEPRKDGCALGDGHACWLINDSRAYDFSEQGCEAGDALDCYTEAMIDFTREPRTSVELFEKTCDLGLEQSCYEAGLAYARGMGIPIDVARSDALFSKGCALKDDAACRMVSDRRVVERGLDAEGSKDYEVARGIYERGCQIGSDSACDHLGFLYEHGLPVLDLSRAFRLYERACSPSYPKGCYDEGRMELEGKGVAQSEMAATIRFERTCASSGYGCGSNDEAAALFDKGCAQNIADSCGELAVLVEKRPLAPIARVIDLYQRACQGGHAPSCYRLGLIFANGDVVEKNPDAARELLARGCDLGDANSCSASTQRTK